MVASLVSYSHYPWFRPEQILFQTVSLVQIYTFSHWYFAGMFPSWLESCYNENRRHDTLADAVDRRVSSRGQKLLFTAASLPNSARIQSTLQLDADSLN